MLSLLFLVLISSSQTAAGQPQNPASADPEELVRAGIAAQGHGDNKSAIQDFQRALAIRPEMAEARVALGAALAAAGQFDAAIEEDSRVLASAPDNITVRMNLGTAYYKKGDFFHAREQFETVHETRPLDVQAAVLLSYVYIKLDRDAAVVDLLMPLEPGHESNMELEYCLAFSLIQTGKEKEGVPRMEKIAQATHSANAYVIAGSAHLHRREMSEAMADLDPAIHLDPSIPGLSTMVGEAQFALGEMTEASASFEKALRSNPRDFTANLDLGAIELKERNYENARSLLELALELEPGFPLARLEMAKLNEATGKYAEAAATLEELVKVNPRWFDAHWELAMVYFSLDRPEDGKRERQLAQQLSAHQQNSEPDAK